MASKKKEEILDKRLRGYEPNFTTPEPKKKDFEKWIAKNIQPKIDKKKKNG